MSELFAARRKRAICSLRRRAAWGEVCLFSAQGIFYTSPVIIGAMYQALMQMGFQEGNILEPSCGIGNFIGMLPEELSASKAYGVEIDSISGRIAGQLYQNSNIAVSGFEKVQILLTGNQDVSAGI